MLLKTISALASIVLLATSATAAPWSLKSGFSKGPKLGVVPTRNILASTDSRNGCSNAPPLDGPIINGGGRILNGTVKIYYIFYGNWTRTQRTIMVDFAKNIGGSAYSNIETTYGATGQMTFADSIADNYSLGTDLGVDGVATVVQTTLDKGLLPADTNSVYFVLASPDVTEGDFCGYYCGYHDYGTMNNTDIAYAFIGNPLTQCMGNCGGCNQKSSPNGDAGVDAMISIVAHELMEAISDPDGATWRDASGNENADKCAWNYGNSVKRQNQTNALYNIVLGKRNYLIQQNWDAKIQGCAMSA